MSNQAKRVTISAEEYAALLAAANNLNTASAAATDTNTAASEDLNATEKLRGVFVSVDSVSSDASADASNAVPVPPKKRGWLFYAGCTMVAAGVGLGAVAAYRKYAGGNTPVPTPEEVGEVVSAFMAD